MVAEERRREELRVFEFLPGDSLTKEVNMELPRGLAQMGAVDARTIVPVRDAYGGVTIYFQGRPTHYLLAGEWYTALAKPIDPCEAALPLTPLYPQI